MAKKKRFDWKAIHEAAAINRSYSTVLPPVVVLHQIGDASLVQLNKGNRTIGYVASYKGIHKTAETKESALMQLKASVRRLHPRPARITRLRSELLGWRIWQVIGDYLLPVAVKTDQFIYEGVVQISDEIPEKQNHNGFWAIKDSEREVFRMLRRSYLNHMAYGQVSLFGRVVEHTLGYRAQKMIIRKLFLTFPASPEFCELMARRYDCDVNVDTRPLPDFDPFAL